MKNFRDYSKINKRNNWGTILKKSIKTHPWINVRNNAKQRCENKNHQSFKYYGGRGIKCFITEDEIEKLWFRDKAWLLVIPSLDRKDNNGDYTFDNCRFIEMSENSGKDKRKIVLQFDLDGNFIKKWKSATEAAKGTHQSTTNVTRCCRGESKSAKGFIWKYKN